MAGGVGTAQISPLSSRSPDVAAQSGATAQKTTGSTSNGRTVSQDKPGPVRTKNTGLSLITRLVGRLIGRFFSCARPAAGRTNDQARRDAEALSQGVAKLLRASSPGFHEAFDKLRTLRESFSGRRGDQWTDVISRQVRYQSATLSSAERDALLRDVYSLPAEQAEAFEALVPGLKSTLTAQLDQEISTGLRIAMKQVVGRAIALGCTGRGGHKTLGVDALDRMMAEARFAVQKYGDLMPAEADRERFALGLVTTAIASSASADLPATMRFLRCLPDGVLSKLRGLVGPVGFHQGERIEAALLIREVHAERMTASQRYASREDIRSQNKAAFTAIVRDGLAGGLPELLSSMERCSDHYLQDVDPVFPGETWLHAWSGRGLREQVVQAVMSECPDDQVQALIALLNSADAEKLGEVMRSAAQDAHKHPMGPYWYETTLRNRVADLDLLRQVAQKEAQQRGLPAPIASQAAGSDVAIATMVRRSLGIPLLSLGDGLKWAVDLRSRADVLNVTAHDARASLFFRNALHAGVDHGLPELLSSLQLESRRLPLPEGAVAASSHGDALDEGGHALFEHAAWHAFALLTDDEVLRLHSMLDGDIVTVMRGMMIEAAGTATSALTRGAEEQTLRARCTDLTVLRDVAANAMRERRLEARPASAPNLDAVEEAREIIRYGLGISLGEDNRTRRSHVRHHESPGDWFFPAAHHFISVVPPERRVEAYGWLLDLYTPLPITHEKQIRSFKRLRELVGPERADCFEISGLDDEGSDIVYRLSRLSPEAPDFALSLQRLAVDRDYVLRELNDDGYWGQPRVGSADDQVRKDINRGSYFVSHHALPSFGGDAETLFGTFQDHLARLEISPAQKQVIMEICNQATFGVVMMATSPPPMVSEQGSEGFDSTIAYRVFKENGELHVLLSLAKDIDRHGVSRNNNEEQPRRTAIEAIALPDSPFFKSMNLTLDVRIVDQPGERARVEIVDAEVLVSKAINAVQFRHGQD